MCLCNAESVGSALHLVASVNACAAPVVREADLIVKAVKIVPTSGGLTALSDVCWITNEALRASANTFIATSVGATSNVCTSRRRRFAGRGIDEA